jgi:FkbM family methyltransferase
VDLRRVANSFPWAARWYRRLRRPRAGSDKNELYDEQTLEVLRRHLRPDSVCVDVGAHSGAILRRMIRFAPDARHYAFEPLPRFAARLRRDFPTVRVYECALGSEPGEATFHHVVNDPGYSGLQQRKYDRSDPEIRRIPVQVTRLDDVIPADCLVSFLKIDAEGGEHAVLLGGVGTIRRCRPLIVFEAGKKSTSFYGVTPEMLFRLLTGECGLAVSTMARWLAGEAPLREDELKDAFRRGTDFYFIAYPDGDASTPP